MRYPLAVVLVCLTAVLVRAQTLTTTNALGLTVVEVITIDPIALVPTTEIIETLTNTIANGLTTTTTPTTALTTSTNTATTSTRTSSTTTTTLNQGPVGAPLSTATGLTTFVYTTTDANGDTTVVDATFTPSFNTITSTPSQTFTGTVLQYSQWLSIVGTNTITAVPSSSGAVHRVSRKVWGAGTAMLAGAVGGVWLVVG